MKNKKEKLTLKSINKRVLDIDFRLSRAWDDLDVSVEVEQITNRVRRLEVDAVDADTIESIDDRVRFLREEVQTLMALAAPLYLKKKPSLWSKIKGWFGKKKADKEYFENLKPIAEWPPLAAVGETYRAPTETPRWVGEGEGPKWETKKAGNWSDPATWENCASKFKR